MNPLPPTTVEEILAVFLYMVGIVTVLNRIWVHGRVWLKPIFRFAQRQFQNELRTMITKNTELIRHLEERLDDHESDRAMHKAEPIRPHTPISRKLSDIDPSDRT